MSIMVTVIIVGGAILFGMWVVKEALFLSVDVAAHVAKKHGVPKEVNDYAKAKISKDKTDDSDDSDDDDRVYLNY